MKDVITGEELKETMIKAIDLLCDSVGSTLGPSGNNVLINRDDEVPYITNDGVTIAEAIESSDKKINTVLEIAKEASLKTNEEVGDGTTTTLVLLKEIYHEGLKEIEKGKNPIVLKKELNNALELVIKELTKLRQEATEKDLLNVAINSSEDIEIGNILTETYLKMKNKYACRLRESNTDKTYVEIKKGYNLDIDNIPSIYFDNKKEIVLKDSYVLILRGYLTDLEQIAEVINEGLNRGKNIVILAEDYDINIEREILLYYLQEHKNIYIFKIPDYGSRKEEIIKDIVSLTDSKVKNIELEPVIFTDLGTSKELIINKEEVLLISNKNVKERLNTLKDELDNISDTYTKEFIASRIAKLENGIATIYVGGNTKTEIKERLMHFEDALCALDTASLGVVIGEGISYLKVLNNLDNKDTGTNILKKVLEVPFNKIMENAGYDKDIIKKKIIESNYQLIYNFKLNDFENIKDTKIIDPLGVVIESLKNAVSIASLLLTTNYLVINDTIKIDKPIL